MRAAVLARLAASHRRHATDSGKLQAAPMAKAAPAEYDRHACRLTSAGLDPGRRPPSEGDGRLQGLDSGQAVIFSRAWDGFNPTTFIPAQAGIQTSHGLGPAFAGTKQRRPRKRLAALQGALVVQKSK